jgi:hypothetical protein
MRKTTAQDDIPRVSPEHMKFLEQILALVESLPDDEDDEVVENVRPGLRLIDGGKE